MSDFKIIGNPNPVVGVLEIYTVSDFFEKIQNNPFSEENSFSYNPVSWEVYVLELGKWRKTKENDKKGNKVSYTFLEKSLTRNGIRILARKGDKVARLDIKPLSAKPKIDHIELLDKNGAKINGRLSYGQTVKARVFCLNMEKRRVSVTMWEYDVKGAGHNKANEKNFIETLSGIVKFGKADIDFLLKPSFAKIAERGGHEKDKIHEFYVTAEYNDGKIASNNINVNALETPVAPYKGKTTPQQSVKSKPAEQKPKNDSQKPNIPTATKAVKGKINAVHITDIAGNQIRGVFKEKQIKVWINSTGLTGKEVRLKLYDEDLVSNDLLFTENFMIKSDLHAIVVSLETDRFRTTKEYSEKGEYKPYFGRGLMQLTWQSNYEIYKAFSGIECVDDYEVIANNLENAFDSAGWYWKQGKVLSIGDRWTPALNAPSYVTIHKPNYPKNKISYKKGDKNINYSTVDFSLIADDDNVDVISYLVNGGSNGLSERRNYVTTLKNIFKFPQECVNKAFEKVSTDTINEKAITIRLVRKWETKKSTIGEFTIDGSEIKGFILEEKGPDTTISGIEQRIPIGTYNLAWHNGTKIKKGLKVYNSDVSKDRAILIHSGNTANDTEGCLLPGSTRSVDFVGNSKNKLNEIFDYIEEKGIDNAKIIITQKYE